MTLHFDPDRWRPMDTAPHGQPIEAIDPRRDEDIVVWDDQGKTWRRLFDVHRLIEPQGWRAADPDKVASLLEKYPFANVTYAAFCRPAS